MLFTHGAHNIPQTGMKSWHGANRKAWLHRNPVFCYCLKDYYLHKILWVAVDLKKSEILARFYRAYVEEQINWDTFCELSEVISRMFVSDIKLLFAVYNKRVSDTSQCPVYQADRLIALGLLDSAMKSMSIGSVSSSHTQRYIQTNQLGNTFCDLSK